MYIILFKDLCRLQMLTDSFESLVDSDMFRGSLAYGYPLDRKPWYGYLYIATFADEEKLKIGVTSNLDRRDMQLRQQTKTQDSGKITYIWSLPVHTEIESKVKEVLFHFTNRDSMESGKTEIFIGIPLYPLILIVRLIILYVFLDRGYITNYTPKSRENLKILKSYLGSLRIDGIKYGRTVYQSQNRKASNRRLQTFRIAVDEINKLTGKGIRDILKRSLLRIVSLIRRLNIQEYEDIDTNQNKDKLYEWIMQWKDTYVDDNEPSDRMREAMAASEEDVFQIPQFESGDIVWITYPDTPELRESHPEWVGTWHARITDVREESGEITYRVEWLEDGYKGTTSGIPEEWVDGSEVKSNDDIIIKHNGVDVRRILDILEVYKKINVPAYIDSLEKEENPDFKALRM